MFTFHYSSHAPTPLPPTAPPPPQSPSLWHRLYFIPVSMILHVTVDSLLGIGGKAEWVYCNIRQAQGTWAIYHTWGLE